MLEEIITDKNSTSVTFQGNSLIFPALPAENKWLSAGSFQNWYSSGGCEIEEGYEPEQQYGSRWPGISENQDMQVAKGFWIGAKDFTDENEKVFPFKVVHVGPRVNGDHEFIQKEFKLTSKFAQPNVFVNGQPSSIYPNQIDEVDPNLPCDRMIYNLVNTQLGISVERKIYQFSQEFQDNYIINEYTFTNTGNTDYDDDIELHDNTVRGIYFYYLYRWAVNKYTRYEIGNATGWGINTMLDTRGDGFLPARPEENFRAQYAWHGYYIPFAKDAYDNIGGPIWNSAINISPEDTIGRLGAPQFIGVVTLHADKSSSDKSDDTFQPATTSWESSDDPLFSDNNSFNDQKMAGEYTWMSKGHKSPRHANAVEPTGKFSEPSGDPSLGTSGGFSAVNGYGPYTLSPGESLRIVWAEAANGIDKETAIEVGREFKRKQISAKQKNEIVLTGKDSLFETFKRALSNYNNGNGFLSPQAPYPPNKFEVHSGEDKIYLSWERNAEGPSVKQFEIYRTSGKYDNNYTLIHVASAADTNFTDDDIERGSAYYYYIQSVGDSGDNNGGAMTPLGSLKSSRYYTQTYDPAASTLTGIIDVKTSINEYVLSQNYPNPFNPATTIRYQIPESGFVTLRIFDVLGRVVKTLVNENKSKGVYTTNYNASDLASGIYIYQLKVIDLSGSVGFMATKKMVLMK